MDSLMVVVLDAQLVIVVVAGMVDRRAEVTVNMMAVQMVCCSVDLMVVSMVVAKVDGTDRNLVVDLVDAMVV